MSGVGDEAAVRRRFSEVADTCGGCRRCTDLCPVFPSLFELLGDRDAGSMTPDEQDRVVDGCWQCSRCLEGCPYGPGEHEVAVDLAVSVRDVRAVVARSGRGPVRDRLGDRLLGRPDLVGRFTTGPVSPVVRAVLRPLAAIGRVRLDVAERQQRVTTWWAQRRRIAGPGSEQAGSDRSALGVDTPDVMLLPSCPAEYLAPGIGRALVEVYERAGLSVRVSEAGCCGAAWLQSGDVERFCATARRTLGRLGEALGEHTVLVVPQTSCADALARTAPQVLGDAELAAVAARVRDPVRCLLDELRRAGASDRARAGRSLQVVHHVSCRSHDGGSAVVELLGLLGAEVEVVRQCSGVGDSWGARRSREPQVAAAVAGLADRMDGAATGSSPVFTTECHHTAAALERITGREAHHPLEIVARLFGG